VTDGESEGGGCDEVICTDEVNQEEIKPTRNSCFETVLTSDRHSDAQPRASECPGVKNYK